ncbi:hypothetical protein [Candidatus Villigracilis saccharophilus]|uniref:hypothetical protein n=1 Tax=Candidatus Villigracilis saccharophilus TaxID=3140684 RepID=UPI0031355C86|nr:hypothetical protein [Anaerolineales bacterium]
MSGPKIGLAVGSYIAEADPEVWKLSGKAAQILKEQGATIIEVNARFPQEAALANGIMTRRTGRGIPS